MVALSEYATTCSNTFSLIVTPRGMSMRQFLVAWSVYETT